MERRNLLGNHYSLAEHRNNYYFDVFQPLDFLFKLLVQKINTNFHKNHLMKKIISA